MYRRSRSPRSRARSAASPSARELLRSFACFAAIACLAAVPEAPEARVGEPKASARGTGCTAQQRRAELRARQSEVLSVAPRQVDSLDRATQPGGPLEGWRLSHGLAVLDGSEAVAVDDLAAKDPMPPLLLYAPSASSTAADWSDFDDPEGPYRLVGWAEIGPYQPGSSPPKLRCVATDEWFVHEAGWHRMDGGMRLTPESTVAPPPSGKQESDSFWHPQTWDIHFWLQDDGVPVISFHRPDARRGGVRLPDGAFFYLVDGRRVPPAPPDAN
jgi:hypothetical protein